ncbi:uncharacterized protein K460DRAFT_270336 [Cucurbitaria berberidis CBS 394.84]|uniref:Rhodopsin domain-containing protein n=1 Tax=Cucurbitaria berberidis CBS 394.84 TaxID=1168544 RepID=A0A9P4LDE2_9PLEO|nr:uncharacterized protein K460DRAFT_270336 [Cucurbitaria berberidis CBS 394.84]KAF1850297.1 hypothetical protein K460DRAFT_270336 [Cucurbitaria berberidis CBS 394.84]
MGCARISVCLVIRKVLPGVVAKYTALVFASFTAIWTVSGVLVSAFPCNLPNPWRFTGAHNCYDLVAFVNYVGITNIVVEVLLVMIPLFIWNLSFVNSSPLADYTYDSWATVLCEQVAQNISVISACLPCLHPFITNILAGATEPETIMISYGAPPCIRQYLNRKRSSFAPSQSSHASTAPFSEKAEEPYCRPLATHGLLHSQSATRFPTNIARTMFTQAPPETFFNRLIEIPRSRPGTPSSNTNASEAPRRLGDVGVIPAIDWDSGSNISGSSRRSSPSRNPTAEYVLNRSKIISVPEEKLLYDAGVRQFAPPLPSPRMPRRPPRAF